MLRWLEAGEDRGMRRQGHRTAREGLFEEGPARRKRIERRRQGIMIAVGAEVIRSCCVECNEQDVEARVVGEPALGRCATANAGW